jgi:hypothetical protein
MIAVFQLSFISDALKKLLQKVNITFIMSVCLSVCMEQLGSHGMDFKEILCWRLLLLNYVDQIQGQLKSDKTNIHFTSRPTNVYDSILLLSSWDEKTFR